MDASRILDRTADHWRYPRGDDITRQAHPAAPDLQGAAGGVAAGALFLASVGFFTAVLVVRGVTVAIHYNFGPFHDVSMGGRHIHHLVWGIILLLLSGYGWLLQVGTGTQDSLQWVGRLMSMIYGVAAALTLDEFALWLNLRDVYWQREGRESFEAMALFGGVLAIGVFGRSFFRGITGK
jgi:hypothetical protein